MARAGSLTIGLAAATLFASGCASGPEGFTSPLLPIEQSLVFWPATYPSGNWILDAGVEDIWLTSTEGATINGWYAESKNPRAVILYMHGNAGNITDLHPMVHTFHDELHATILVFDYRGYGRSTGSPSETGVLDDARAARAWLAKRTGIAESEVVLAGHSLGGGVAVDLAARDGACALILESTFTSLPDAADYYAPVSPLMQMRFDSLAKITKYRGPLLQTHGDRDTIIPFENGRKLYKAANEPKHFVAIHGGGHNDPPAPEYVDALDHFLDSLGK